MNLNTFNCETKQTTHLIKQGQECLDGAALQLVSSYFQKYSLKPSPQDETRRKKHRKLRPRGSLAAGLGPDQARLVGEGTQTEAGHRFVQMSL